MSDRLQMFDQRADSQQNCSRDNKEERLLHAESEVQVARMLLIEFPGNYDSAIPHLAKAWRLLQKVGVSPTLQPAQAETLEKLLNEDHAFYRDDVPSEPIARSKVWDFSNLLLDTAARHRRREKLSRLKVALSSRTMRYTVCASLFAVASLLTVFYMFFLAPLIFPTMRYTAEFFNGQSFEGHSGFSATFSELHFPSFGSALPKGVDSNSFSARFQTCLILERETPVKFITTSDDGSRILVNGKLVVDNWRVQGMTEQSGVQTLAAGTHHVSLEYFQGGWGAGLIFNIDHAETGKSLKDHLRLWNKMQNACL